MEYKSYIYKEESNKGKVETFFVWEDRLGRSYILIYNRISPLASSPPFAPYLLLRPSTCHQRCSCWFFRCRREASPGSVSWPSVSVGGAWVRARLGFVLAWGQWGRGSTEGTSPPSSWLSCGCSWVSPLPRLHRLGGRWAVPSLSHSYSFFLLGSWERKVGACHLGYWVGLISGGGVRGKFCFVFTHINIVPRKKNKKRLYFLFRSLSWNISSFF